MLRLHIAEKWEPQDYLTAISSVETMYYVTLFAHRDWTREPWEIGQRVGYDRFYRRRDQFADFLIEEARALADRDERLIIDQVRHASPGFIDFEGLGPVVEALDKVFGRVIDLVTERRMRRELDERAKVETDIQRENLNSMKVENARKLLDLFRDYPELGPDRSLERTLIDQQTRIEGLAARGLITNQREHDED